MEYVRLIRDNRIDEAVRILNETRMWINENTPKLIELCVGAKRNQDGRFHKSVLDKIDPIIGSAPFRAVLDYGYGRESDVYLRVDVHYPVKDCHGGGYAVTYKGRSVLLTPDPDSPSGRDFTPLTMYEAWTVRQEMMKYGKALEHAKLAVEESNRVAFVLTDFTES